MKRILIVGALVLISATAYLLGWSGALTVSKVIIAEPDKAIAAEISARLSASPDVIPPGTRIARVDKDAIARRLTELIWISQVEVERNFINREVTVSVAPRSAIARVRSSAETLGSIEFLGDDLATFTIPANAVDKAARSGGVDWRQLPELTLGDESLELRSDVVRLLTFLTDAGAKTMRLVATNREEMRSKVEYSGRELDISWGNVKELELKRSVLDRLLELKANKSVSRIDLTEPLAPTVVKE